MITILSDPSHVVQVSPAIVSRWLATESPNNFRLQRKDFAVSSEADSGGYLSLSFGAAYTGNEGNSISVYDATTGAMLTGTVTSIASPATSIVTDIPWVAGMNIEYLNDHTLYAGYYFEGRLTINGIVQALTVIASPDSFGKADLDVSGILRISISNTKVGDYSALLAKETTKSGSFTFAYRGAWYGSSESYTEETNTWYYGEVVRSEEEGSNLYDYLYTGIEDVPFLNSFDQPVYFLGLPFDISFVLPELNYSPSAEIVVSLKQYNAANTLLATTNTVLDMDDFDGRICSLTIDPATIQSDCDHLTVEVI